MKTSHILIAALALPLAGFAKEEKKALALAEVPAPVAAAITTAAGKEKVTIKAEKEDGIDAFEAKWTAGGTKHEITVKPDGTVMSEEVVVTLDSTPAPVQAAIKAITGKLTAVEKVTEKDATIYEAQFETADGKLEVKFDGTGKETERETARKKDKKDEKDEDEEKDDDKEEHGKK